LTCSKKAAYTYAVIVLRVDMNPVFKALADRNRRKMLDRLFAEPGLSLSELIRDLKMTRQSASRHVSILAGADLVVTYWNGREKLHYLNPVPLVEVADRWLDKFTQDNARAVLALKLALEESKNE
jgi:DNA-binding transcriptional ArsR family regulator